MMLLSAYQTQHGVIFEAVEVVETQHHYSLISEDGCYVTEEYTLMEDQEASKRNARLLVAGSGDRWMLSDLAAGIQDMRYRAWADIHGFDPE